MVKEVVVLSAWGNEEIIAPFFLKHYFDLGVNKIYIFLDHATTDNTYSILCNHEQYKNNNIIIHKAYYPEGFCDELKINYINAQYKILQDEWAICCDADEFVYTKDYLEHSIKLNTTLEKYEQEGEYILGCFMTHPFRHKTEQDLDINIDKIIKLRRYGLEYSPTSEKIPISKEAYKKPSVVKAGLPIHWSPGHHVLFGDPQEKTRITPNCYLNGVHWKYADISIAAYAATNKINNMNYYKRNISRGMAHNWVETAEEAILKCKENLDCPRLF